MDNRPAIDMLKCQDCGGLFFVKSRAERYQKAGYGSAEFRSTETMEKTVLQCIGCGALVPPRDQNFARNTIAQMQQEDFTKSVKAGQEYRRNNSMQNFSKIAVSPQELKRVEDLVEDLRKELRASLAAKDSPSKTAATKSKETHKEAAI